MEQLHQRPPSAEEIATELDMTITEVKTSMKNSGRHLSMDAPFKEGENSNLYESSRSSITSTIKLFNSKCQRF